MNDIDNEDKLTGELGYGSPTWKLIETDKCISIVPILLPWHMYIILDIFLPAMGLCFSLITKNLVFFWFMIFAALVIHIFLYLWMAHNLKKGPYMLWDKLSGKVELPRRKISLNAKDIIEFRHISGFHGLGSYNYKPIAELNIITKAIDDSMVKYPIVGGIPNELQKKISNPLSQATCIPLKIIELKWAQRQM